MMERSIAYPILVGDIVAHSDLMLFSLIGVVTIVTYGAAHVRWFDPTTQALLGAHIYGGVDSLRVVDATDTDIPDVVVSAAVALQLGADPTILDIDL